MKITRQMIEDNLKKGFDQIEIKEDKELFDIPVSRAKGDEWYLDGTARKKNNPFSLPYKSLLASALALVLIFGFIRFNTNMKTYATIYLDVNPSVCLSINRKQRVIEVKAKNRDGEKILDGMDLKNADINVAVNALLGSMIRNNYLNEAHNMLLLSIDCDSQSDISNLAQDLSEEINTYLKAFLNNPEVITRKIDVDEGLLELAEKYDISASKAQIIEELIEDTDLRFEDLADLSITEIFEKVEAHGVSREEIIDEIEDFYEDDDREDNDDDDLDGDDRYDEDERADNKDHYDQDDADDDLNDDIDDDYDDDD